MQDIKLNLEEFEELVQPQPPGTGPCINIHSSGNISLNAKLLEKLHTRELRVLVSHDREMILLDEKGESTFRFPKGGSVTVSYTHLAAARRLETRFTRNRKTRWTSPPRFYLFFAALAFTAVSYTHLAVYKRQDSGRSARR